MTTEQKQNLALAAEAAIIIYLLWKKSVDCKGSGGGGGQAAPPAPRIFIPPIQQTNTATATITTGETVSTEEATAKVREPRTGGIKPIRTNQPPPPPDEPNDLGYVPEACPKGNGWYLCPTTAKCYPPKSEADPTIDYCGDGNTPTLQRFATYVKGNFFSQERSRFN